MKDKKKVYSFISILVISMILILGVSYAVLNYKKTGTNQELIVGDIWMKYEETNGLILEDAMPVNIEKHMGYQINPMMKNQEVVELNELDLCMNIYTAMYYVYDEGTNSESFCKGTGTSDGLTISENLSDWSFNNEYFLEEGGQKLLDAGVILEESDRYIVNPIISQQETSTNELSACINFYTNFEYEFDEGTTAESFCKGEGTAYGGNTIDGDLEVLYKDNEYFLIDGGQYLLDTGIIIPKIMDYQTFKAKNEMTEAGLSNCIDIFRDEWQSELDEGEDWESCCNGSGTCYGSTFKEMIESGDWYYNELKFFADNDIIDSFNHSLPYFEFKISGKNTYTKKDIWYELVLSYGDEHDNRTTRIRDDLLRFSLTEIKDGVERIVVDNQKYNDIQNKKIWVSTIDKNTNQEIEIVYKLYMWIDESIVIGNIDEDYTLEEWDDVYASIKVNVNGDFTEKNPDLPESCFAIEEIDETSISIVGYDSTCGSKIVIPSKLNGKNVIKIANKAFYGRELTSVIIPDSVITIEAFAFYNNNIKEVNIPESVTYLDCNAFESIVKINKKDALICSSIKTPENCFTTVDLDSTTVSIIDYDKTCGSDVVIPETINGKTVVSIGHNSGKGFSNKDLTNVVISNTVLTIAAQAFESNNLTVIDIPDSVTKIEGIAFWKNSLTKVILGENVSEIGDNAFITNIDFYSRGIITQIINKSGNSFNWNKVIGWLNGTQNEFVTGIIKIENNYGEIVFTIPVTSE